MTETIITVQGHHEARHPAERATVHAAVTVDGPERAAVFTHASDAAAELRASVEQLHDAAAGPVVSWSSDSVRVWTERPWGPDGAQLAPVFHAAISLRATFVDFRALASWVEGAAELAGVSIERIEWALSETKRIAVTAEVRSRAVRDAADKARVFAQSIGLGTVTAIALADPGMLGDPSGPGGAEPFARGALMAKAEAGGALSFTPEDIVVEASVDARFVAR